LLDHALRVVANAVEAIGDFPVALAELHRRDLLAHDLVEQRRLRQRARDRDDLVLIELRHAVQERHDRRLLGLLGYEAEIAEPRHGFVEILDGRGHGVPLRVINLNCGTAGLLGRHARFLPRKSRVNARCIAASVPTA
jgi:hypothetical protein